MELHESPLTREVETPEVKKFVDGVYNEGQDAQASIHIEVGKTTPELFNKLSPQEKSLVLESFDGKGEKIIVVNPCHGNEPYILGLSVAENINDLLEKKGQKRAKIVVPLIYEGRQEQILRETFPARQDEIYLDRQLGLLYEQVLFRNGRFDQHLAELIANQSRVQDLILEHLSGNLEVKLLATGETVDLNGRDVVLDVNAGSRFITHQDSYFVFPVLLSELLEETAKTDLPFDHEKLSAIQRAAQDRESQYLAKFIPEIHTFSYKDDDYPREGKTFTPPLKHPVENPPEIESEGIYVMTSGTGSEVENVTTSAQDLGLELFKSPFIHVDYGRSAIPDVIYHPNIVAVFGRMGWGTGWISQQAEKPFIVIPYNFPDDPEIYFNLKTLQEKKLGLVYQGQRDIVRRALELTGNIREINQSVFKKFGTKDGIDYVARKIVDDFHERRNKLTRQKQP